MWQLLLVYCFTNWGVNMDKICVGKIVSTHGIKGEIRILSDFSFKERVFATGMRILIDDLEYTICTYRHHKQFEMVTLEGFDNINDVLFLMNKKVYFDKSFLQLADDEVLDSDLIHYRVLTTEGKTGIIKEIFWASPSNKILRVLFEREVLIPFSSPMIMKIDKSKQTVLVNLIAGM